MLPITEAFVSPAQVIEQQRRGAIPTISVFPIEYGAIVIGFVERYGARLERALGCGYIALARMHRALGVGVRRTGHCRTSQSKHAASG